MLTLILIFNLSTNCVPNALHNNNDLVLIAFMLLAHLKPKLRFPNFL
jgi:hypothetical protein